MLKLATPICRDAIYSLYYMQVFITVLDNVRATYANIWRR